MSHVPALSIDEGAETVARNTAPGLQARQTRLLFSQGRAGTSVTAGVAAALTLFSWKHVPVEILFSWVLGVMAINAWRLYLVYSFERVAPEEAELPVWRRRFLVGTAASGIMLGSAWWLIAPHASFEAQVVLSFVLGGMCVGGAHVLGSAFNVYVIYVTALCLPGTVFFAAQGTQTYLAMSALTLIFVVAVIITGRGYHRTLMRIMLLTSANEILREDQLRLRDFADMGADLLWECDKKGHYTYISDGYEQLTGVEPKAVIGKPIDGSPGPCFVPNDRLLLHLSDTRDHGFADQAIVWTRQTGDTIVMLSSAVPAHDSTGRFTGFRGTVRDITEQHRRAEKLTYQATHDVLTDLVNRREFEHRLHALLGRAHAAGTSHCMCFVDLDQFKVVNDTCGHAAGDALLREVARQLRLRLRARDTVARLGGDEFGLLIEHCGLDDATAVVRDVQTGIQSMRFEWEECVFRLTASIGLVMVEPDSADMTEVMRRADVACYRAKESGRNRIHVYIPADEDLSRRHKEMHSTSAVARNVPASTRLPKN